VLQQWHTFTHFLYFYKPSRFLSISPWYLLEIRRFITKK
jgi:hypothetical protein